MTEASSKRESKGGLTSFMQSVRIEVGDTRMRRILLETLARLPAQALDIPSLKSIMLVEVSPTQTLAAQTTHGTYECTLRDESGREWVETRFDQRIELFLDILDQLSDQAVQAVIAHELAHAWLNDHTNPEDSKRREEQSDKLAGSWGFADELTALAHETV